MSEGPRIGRRVLVPLRACALTQCGKTLERREDERPYEYRRRRYCSRGCYQTASSERNRLLRSPAPVVVDLTPEVPFRHAHVRTFAELPTTCSRDGGPWRYVTGGVVCATCGFERIVAEAFREHPAVGV